MKPSIAILWQLVAIGLVLVVALLNIWQLHHYFSKYQAIYWHNDCWYLLINNRKTAINVEADTRVLPYWVLLQYTPIKNSILSKNKLLLPKDAMCDKDYRDLSRTLRFIEQTTETSIS